jgi:hypothetical protein
MAHRVIGTDGELGVIDPNRWAVAERGSLLASGYTEIRSVHRTKNAARGARTALAGDAWTSRMQYRILKRDDHGRWGPA